MHVRRFRERHGAGSTPRFFFAPGRVNLMGAHLDYNGGPVMPTAIDRGTFLAIRERPDRTLRLASTLDPATLEIELDALPRVRTGRWVDYPLGVVHAVLELPEGRRVLDRLRGLDVLFGGNLPVGAGLSSSASICVGTAFALNATWALGLERMALVRAALVAEREFVGVRCGIMDPYAVGLAREGHLLWLDCKDASSEYLPLDTARLSIAVADTHVRRELAQVAFNERVAQCRAAFETLRRHQPGASCLRDIRKDVFEDHRRDLDATSARRAEHVLAEVERTFAARDALKRGDSAAFGAQMLRTHRSLRYLFEVSVPELDRLVDSAAGCPGVLGARLTGAGFGGCAVILVETAAAPDVAERLAIEFEREFRIRPSIGIYEGDAGPREITGPLED